MIYWRGFRLFGIKLGRGLVGYFNHIELFSRNRTPPNIGPIIIGRIAHGYAGGPETYDGARSFSGGPIASLAAIRRAPPNSTSRPIAENRATRAANRGGIETHLSHMPSTESGETATLTPYFTFTPSSLRGGLSFYMGDAIRRCAFPNGPMVIRRGIF